jgi:putative heme-binding domain-containing protein
LSPPVRREAAEAIFARTGRLPALLDGLEKGRMSSSDLDADRRKLLLENPSFEIRDRARSLLKEEGSADRKSVIEKRRGALSLKGDPARGKEVFRRVCATCHKLGKEGHEVAPNFATVRDKSAEALLIGILDPNREVAPGFISYQVVTVDGRVATGVIASENDSSVTLRRAEGVEETLLRSQIRGLESSGVSLMPEGLEKDLSLQDLADLIEAILAET